LAHGRLHTKVDQERYDREQREIEAEAVSYVVMAHFGVETKGHKYMAAWQERFRITDGLERISTTAQYLIDKMEAAVKAAT
tara:strand:+ start:297 stop:539 length:243 start_codon:yes stop_codon:yes gene_type:complete